MKKIIIIVSTLFLLILVSMIGTLLITQGEEIKFQEDPLIYQKELGEQIEIYGYTLEEPNVILNPYELSPLTALISFETDEYAEIEVSIINKNKEVEYLYTSSKSKRHYLPIYKLYPNYDNIVIIKYKNKKKEIIIKTSDLPQDINILEYHDVVNDLYFETNSNYLYAYDNNHDIRWYYTDYRIGNITKVNNNHFIISNNQKVNDSSTTGIIEIDLLGKIYYEYLLKDGYYGSSMYKDNRLLISSNKTIELDRQTGNIIPFLEEEALNNDNDIKLANPNYDNQKEGIRFGNLNISKVSDTSIIVLNYKDLNKKYKIEYKKEYNRLIIKGNFNKEDKVYIVLDKLLGKKVYELKDNYLCINDIGLKYKYNIYVEINNKLYKTNKYVKF